MTAVADIDLLPPGFAWLGFGPDRFVLVNDNSDGHRSTWTSAEAMRAAAWDWWYDVAAYRTELAKRQDWHRAVTAAIEARGKGKSA